MQMRFRRELSALSAVFAMAEEFCADDAALRAQQNTLDFVLEEVFTNLIKYGAATGEKILIALDREANQLVVSITDFDAERFDMRSAPVVDVTLPLEERTPGGLGIHLIKKMVDRIDYDYANRTSRITIYKRLE
jgi:anti-sigma regulatory factor (Ser/Thr protein kinase)